MRNLDDVFGENDPVRRRAGIDEIFADDCVFHEPRGTYRGRDEIHRIAGAIKATHPDFRYQPLGPPEELGNGGRVRWVSGRPGEAAGGRAIAFALADRGAQVIATDLNTPSETVARIGTAAIGLRLDVANESDWASVAEQSKTFGAVDIVVNNAGYFPNRPIEELDFAAWRTTIATNLDSHFLSVKQFLPSMKKRQWGRFVGISSNMVGLPIPGMSHYIASKMGIIGFMRGLANDVAEYGVTANAVLPGLTNTPATAGQSEQQRRAAVDQQAIKRIAEPKDITGAVLFLTSGDAEFITGQSIVVDGGSYRI